MDLEGQTGHGVAPTSCMAAHRKPLGKIIEKFQMKYKSVVTFRILKNLHLFSSLVNVDMTGDIQSLEHKRAFKC